MVKSNMTLTESLIFRFSCFFFLGLVFFVVAVVDMVFVSVLEGEGVVNGSNASKTAIRAVSLIVF